MKLDLYMIRHGEALGNVVDYDCPDGMLTLKGIEQAKKVPQAFENVQLTHILSSPLQRALQTAVILATSHHLRIDVWKRTHECRGGERFIGPALNELCGRYPLADFPNDMEPEGWVYDGPEPAEASLQRAYDVAERLCREFNDARIAMVSHGGFIQMMLRAFLGLTDPRQGHFLTENTSIHHVKIRKERISLVKVNDTTHLG